MSKRGVALLIPATILLLYLLAKTTSGGRLQFGLVGLDVDTVDTDAPDNDGRGLAAHVYSANNRGNGAVCRKPYDARYPLSPFIDNPTETIFNFASVADLDAASSSSRNGTQEWVTYVLKGKLKYNKLEKIYSIERNKDHEIAHGSFAFDDRGMELSELITYDNRILAVDDKSGILYEQTGEIFTPRLLLPNGDGTPVHTGRGFKGEWMAVKDEILYVGSVGKPHIKNGQVVHTGNMWVKAIDCNGVITHHDWTKNYQNILNTLGYGNGYIVHEAVVWSPTLAKWLLMPRLVSELPYDQNTEHLMGKNLLIFADETFTNIHFTEVGDVDPLLGCSTIKLIPNTGDRHILMVKTKEFECHRDGVDTRATCQTESHVSVVDIDGHVLMPQEPLANYKIEGIEFV